MEVPINAKTPPVPPANRSDKGPGEGDRLAHSAENNAKPGVPDPAKQGQAGNTNINLTPQLSVQDR